MAHRATALLLCLAATLLPGAAATKGFKLELVDAGSPRSPHYNGNVTALQRLQRMLASSAARAAVRDACPSEAGALLPCYGYFGSEYLVVLYVGSGSGSVAQFLSLDTAGGLIWTNCAPCQRPGRPGDPLFDPAKSTTYRQLPCKSPFCTSREYCFVDTMCMYNVTYNDTSFAAGILSTDAFSSADSLGHEGSIGELIFGCTHQSSVGPWMLGPSGVLGMSRARRSFAVQTSDITEGRFAYCLFDPANKSGAHIRFGDDIPAVPGAKTFSFLPAGEDGFYYLDVVDVGVDGVRLYVPSYVFQRRADGSGGVIVDSGVAITHLVRPAFEALRWRLGTYFAGRAAVDGRKLGVDLELCYEYDQSVRLPTVWLVMAGGEAIEISAGSAFAVAGEEKKVFCLAMTPHERWTALGAMQQRNLWMEFDVVKGQLTVAPHDCSVEPTD